MQTQISTCSVNGCEKPAHYGGLCSMHAERKRKHGDPSITKKSATVFTSDRLLGNKNAVRHGHWLSPAWRSWSGMIERCRNPNAARYLDYGGRGISVCERWQSFENFLADMGERPVGMTLDRRDNDLGYSPDNCRWATPQQQAQNRRNGWDHRRKTH